MKTTRLFENQSLTKAYAPEIAFATNSTNGVGSMAVPLSDELANQVRRELEYGEKLVWVGQPLPARLAKQTLPIILFAIPWTAFAVFWICGAARPLWEGDNQQADIFNILFPLFGLPFLMIGIGMLSAPWWAYRSAFRTCYVITNFRAILFTAGLNKNVEIRSYRPTQMTRVVRNENLVNGVGDLILEEFEVADSEGSKSLKRQGFIGIPQVHEVEKLLRKTLLDEATSTQ